MHTYYERLSELARLEYRSWILANFLSHEKNLCEQKNL